MELPLQHSFFDEIKEEFSSFNPCFNGTTSATGKYGVIFAIDEFVSILVLMELPLQHFQ